MCGNISKSRATIGAVFVAGCLGLACASSPEDQYRRRLAQTPPEAVHAVYTARLRAVMADLGADLPRMWPQQIQEEREAEQRRERERRFCEATDLGVKLEVAADYLPGSVADSDLDAEQREAFMALAKDLGQEGRELSRAVAMRDLDKMQTVMAQITATCDACHTRFRAQAGPLSPQ